MFGKLHTEKYYRALAMAQVKMGDGGHWASRMVRIADKGCQSLATLVFMSSVLYNVCLYHVIR